MSISAKLKSAVAVEAFAPEPAPLDKVAGILKAEVEFFFRVAVGGEYDASAHLSDFFKTPLRRVGGCPQSPCHCSCIHLKWYAIGDKLLNRFLLRRYDSLVVEVDKPGSSLTELGNKVKMPDDVAAGLVSNLAHKLIVFLAQRIDVTFEIAVGGINKYFRRFVNRNVFALALYVVHRADDLVELVCRRGREVILL